MIPFPPSSSFPLSLCLSDIIREAVRSQISFCAHSAVAPVLLLPLSGREGGASPSSYAVPSHRPPPPSSPSPGGVPVSRSDGVLPSPLTVRPCNRAVKISANLGKRHK